MIKIFPTSLPYRGKFVTVLFNIAKNTPYPTSAKWAQIGFDVGYVPNI